MVWEIFTGDTQKLAVSILFPEEGSIRSFRNVGPLSKGTSQKTVMLPFGACQAALTI